MPDTPDLRIRSPIGIDLGTTNSVAALLDDSGTSLIVALDAGGKKTFPSVVGWDERGRKVAVGRDALGLPDDDRLPLASVKRHMGLGKRFPLGPRDLSPEEVSALILKRLRDALEATVEDVRRQFDRAIITMPAYFNHGQIEATRRAGELAGFEVVELLHEPTAAAIYYSWLHGHGDATYLVYDLGGGTFDVSVIRRRLGDHEVLAVSGDPFLGGDDFDRLLAVHLLDHGVWKWNDRDTPAGAAEKKYLFDPTHADGAGPFARVVRIAEQIKAELTVKDAVSRFVPRVLAMRNGREMSADVNVTREAFEALIRDKIDRTIACCHEALALAKEKAGVTLEDIDHVVLVGGSSRVPAVREAVRAAFADENAARHAKSTKILLHEPDLCVAYGAALRAAAQGTGYVLPPTDKNEHVAVEVRLTSPACTDAAEHSAAGYVKPVPAEGASIRVQSEATGLMEEVFLDENGSFAVTVALAPESDNVLHWSLCDDAGDEVGTFTTHVNRKADARALGRGVLPTQILTRPLSIEVLTRGRQRIRQVLAPVGSPLPATFRCVCRTTDQSSRIVVPIHEDSRVVRHLVLENIDPTLPVGSPVEVEFTIDTTHKIEVRICVKPGAGKSEREERATIEPPPPPGRPTREDIFEVESRLEAILAELAGRHRSRLRARADQVLADLTEALSYDDEPRAIQRLAEFRELVAQAEMVKAKKLDPAWPRFATLVRECIDLCAETAKVTGRDRDELTQHVRTQERYAETAYEDIDQAAYKECFDNLTRYRDYLRQLMADSLPKSVPSGPAIPPDVQAKSEMDEFRQRLSQVWKRVKSAGRGDLDSRMASVAKQAAALTNKVKSDPVSAVRELRSLRTEIDKVEASLAQPAPEGASDSGGMLEGSA